jgi:L-methionine (R)-S-oxide reductase
MFQITQYQGTLIENYETVIKQLAALIHDEPNRIANLANASALLAQFLENINWVGFYLVEDNELILGPFQGLPACVRIPFGKGVCGTAAVQLKTIVVADVHQFPGHIACDAASLSEIVIPVLKDGQLLAILDIDSPLKDRFSPTDQSCLERFINMLSSTL